MSPESLSVLASIVGAFPQIVMTAVGMVLVGLLVAMAVAEFAIRYAQDGPAEYSKLDRKDGLGR